MMLARRGLYLNLKKVRDDIYIDPSIPEWIQGQELTFSQIRRIGKAYNALARAHLKFVRAVTKVMQEIEAEG